MLKFKKKKYIMVVDKYNWLDIDYNALSSSFRPYGIIRKLSNDYSSDYEITEDDLSRYGRFVEYHVCVDLELYPRELDRTLPDHRKVFCDYVAKAKGFEDHLLRSIASDRPQQIMFCQGYQYESFIIRKICAQQEIDLLAIENTFDARKFVWDDVSGVTVNRNLAENFYWKYEGFVDQGDARDHVREYLNGIGQNKLEEHTTGSAQLDYDASEKIVLFLGQVYTDSSVLFGIYDFKNQIDIIRQLSDYCVKNGYKLIVKLHPKEVEGKNIHQAPYNKVTYRNLEAEKPLLEDLEEYEFIVDYGFYDTYDLIEKSSVCVTINSQSGFEALLFGKDVVLCGKSFYSNFGVTFNAYDRSDLNYNLDRVLKENVSRNDKNVTEKIFYVVTSCYFKFKTIDNYLSLLR